MSVSNEYVRSILRADYLIVWVATMFAVDIYHDGILVEPHMWVPSALLLDEREYSHIRASAEIALIDKVELDLEELKASSGMDDCVTLF